jgi:hypothetical protein
MLASSSFFVNVTFSSHQKSIAHSTPWHNERVLPATTWRVFTISASGPRLLLCECLQASRASFFEFADRPLDQFFAPTSPQKQET